MIPRIDSRIYTNLVLTVIAVVMLATAAQQVGINIVGSAGAQSAQARNVQQTATGVTIDSTIPQTQDVAVAQATSEVAASNREIAAAIRELAIALRESSADVKSAIGRPAAASSTTGAAPAEPAERPQIEVTR